jgi:ribosomal protein L11 methyltransferase
MILHIDPGTAFGTGMHETTQLCIKALRKYVTPGARLLDVGCGSGILGILGLMFGAGFAAGTDLDICAIEATAQNKEENSIAVDDYKVYIGNIYTSSNNVCKVNIVPSLCKEKMVIIAQH